MSHIDRDPRSARPSGRMLANPVKETDRTALETQANRPRGLYDYQFDIFAGTRRSYGAGRRAVLLQLQTGGGKTHIFTAIAESSFRKGRRVLVVVHRRELAWQASAKLALVGAPHGFIANGFPASPNELVQVGTIQTLTRRLKSLPQFDLIIFDEAHHIRAAQWVRLIQNQPTARLLGVTATPARLDGKGLGLDAGGFFDDLIIGPPTAWLIDQGNLSAVKCFVPEQKLDLSGVKTVAGDYKLDQLEATLLANARLTGDAVEDYRNRADHLPAVAYCATVKHAERVAAEFGDAGYRAQVVHGKTPKKLRDALIAGLANGEVEVLVSCDIINEGVDVPGISCVILLRPTKSLVLHRQQIGRGMRPAPGKSVLIVHDHAGNCLDHGLPEIDPVWTLDGTKPAKDPVWRCSNCGYEKPLGEPRGGRQELVAIPGGMAELTPEILAAVGRLSYAQVLSRNMTEDELRAFARYRGYADGWVRRRLWEQRNLTPAERLANHRSWVAARGSA
jgi:DNA repair protein RadD